MSNQALPSEANISPTGTTLPGSPSECPKQYCSFSQPAQHIVVRNPPFGLDRVQIVCPWCGFQVITTTRYESGILTWSACLACTLCGCVFGCCLVPFCFDCTKDVVHVCPNCHVRIGHWNRL